jgi:arylsulfatase A-like enzyme
VPQEPIQGVSLAYAFNDPKAPTRHVQQYFFLFGSGAIVKDGWKASFNYRPDGLDTTWTFPRPGKLPNHAGEEVWELYDLKADFNERKNLARTHPEKVAELKAAFHAEATANNVYPLINWSDIWNRSFLSMVGRSDVYGRDGGAKEDAQ